MPTFLDTRESREFYVEDTTAPLRQSLGAMFDIPTFSKGLTRELGKLHADAIDPDRLTKGEIALRIGDLDLDIEEGVSSTYLDMMIEDKNKENRRNLTMSRAQQGLLAGTAHFGAGLVATLLDPVETAVSMVPVVGATRYAAMLEAAGTTAGRAGVRAGVGAAGGFAGSVAIEPFIYGFAQSRQENYGFQDAFFNIALGTVLGGGLHTAGGYVKDKLTRAPVDSPVARTLDNVAPETREHALRTAVNQYGTGRRIDIEPILQADPYYSYTLGKQIQTPPEGVGGARRGTIAEVDATVKTRLEEARIEIESRYEGAVLPRGKVKELQGRQKNLEHTLSQLDKKIEQASKKGRKKDAKGRKKAIEEREKVAREIEDIRAALKADNEIRAGRNSEMAEIDRSKELLDTDGLTDRADMPPLLRRMFDEELKTRSRESSATVLQSAMDAQRRQDDFDSYDLYPTRDELEQVNRQVKERSNLDEDQVLDEAIEDVKKLLDDVGDDIDIKRDMRMVDEEIKILEEEASELEDVAKQWLNCRRVNG